VVHTLETEDVDWDAGCFVGGSLCLDFCNTQGGRSKARDNERLSCYQDVVSWARAAQGVDAGEANALLLMAQAHPEQASRSLEQLRTFRERLHGLFAALASNQAPLAADLTRVRTEICAALARSELIRHEQGFSWAVATETVGLQTLLARVALSAQQLLGSEAVVHVRECERCSWLFVDRSKNKRRRWCKTETCGNRARAARHYQMSKG
jgi:predicted RNA-binding Zn ribbon-like protein